MRSHGKVEIIIFFIILGILVIAAIIYLQPKGTKSKKPDYFQQRFTPGQSIGTGRTYSYRATTEPPGQTPVGLSNRTTRFVVPPDLGLIIINLDGKELVNINATDGTAITNLDGIVIVTLELHPEYAGQGTLTAIDIDSGENIATPVQ